MKKGGGSERDLAKERHWRRVVAEWKSTDLSAAHVGGLLQIGEHLDATLQTEVENLHVCDCSVLPANVRLTPVFTLVCLGKYLATHLANVL